MSSSSSKSSDSSGQSSGTSIKDLEQAQENYNKKAWLKESFALVTACHLALKLTSQLLSICVDKIKDCVVAGLTNPANQTCISQLTSGLAEVSYDLTLEDGNQLWIRAYINNGLRSRFSQGLDSAADANHYLHQSVANYALAVDTLSKRILDADDHLQDHLRDLTLRRVERLEIAHLATTIQSILHYPDWAQLSRIAEDPDDPYPDSPEPTEE
jgi:hypothetical protein